MSPLYAFELLRSHNVPFVVIGGHAVNFHGRLRATEDFDLVFLRSPPAEESLFLALQSINACWIGKEIDPETGLERLIPVTAGYIQDTHLMMLWTDIGCLDVFDYIPGHPRTNPLELWSSAQELHGIRYANREWLIAMKKASGRPVDLLDISYLQELG